VLALVVGVVVARVVVVRGTGAGAVVVVVAVRAEASVRAVAASCSVSLPSSVSPISSSSLKYISKVPKPREQWFHTYINADDEKEKKKT
jgi:hypothetical protein